MASSANIAEALNWVITAPFLLEGAVKPDLWSLPDSQKLIEDTRKNPESIAEFLTKRPRQNLGSLFEYLVFYWLENLPQVRVIGHNLQLRDDKNTFGEIDVLFEYDGAVYQWELAIKFYACDGAPEDEANWLGPLRRDNLKRKLDRLLDFQLHHFHHDYAQPLLKKYGLAAGEINAYPFVKGCLYSPFDKANITLPPRLSENGLHGRWLPMAALDQYLAKIGATEFSILAKSEWLLPVARSNWTSCQNEALHRHLTAKFEENPTPRQVALAVQQQEIQRPFIMPDSWSDLPRV